MPPRFTMRLRPKENERERGRERERWCCMHRMLYRMTLLLAFSCLLHATCAVVVRRAVQRDVSARVLEARCEDSACTCATLFLCLLYMRLLDLFSGTHSVGIVAKEIGFTVTSLDISDASICCNVLDWDYKQFSPGYFDIVWASPPCDTFSHARFKNVGRFGITRESIEADIQNIGVPLLRKTQEIIDYFQPKYYFIENPDTGQMKRFLAELPYYKVDYCMYGFQCRKRTRIWTNLDDFKPKLCDKKCGSFVNGKHIINSVGGNGKQKGQGSGSDKRERYKIPASLIQNLLYLTI